MLCPVIIIMKGYFFIAILVGVFLVACKGNKNNLYVIFDKVDGITEGSKVLVNGFEAGSVKSLDLVNRKIIAKLDLNPSLSVPAGSKIFIQSTVLGYAAVYIEMAESKVYLAKGDTITGIFEKAGILDNLVSDSATKTKILKSLDKIMEAADSIRLNFKDSGKIKILNTH